jgi:hypothetical protein
LSATLHDIRSNTHHTPHLVHVTPHAPHATCCSRTRRLIHAVRVASAVTAPAKLTCG